MKGSMIFVLVAAMLVAVSALPKRDPPKLQKPTGGNPNFGSYGSFNPRGRRDTGKGKIVVDQPINGKATVDGSYDKKIYDGEYGNVHVYGNVQAAQDGKPHANAGVHAEITFGGGEDAGDSAAVAEQLRLIQEYRKRMQLDR